MGQKRAFLPRHFWAIRARLELAGNLRDLALLNLAIDSKLRGCDLVGMKVSDAAIGDTIKERATVIQSKTGQPVEFEITENTRKSISVWIDAPQMAGCAFLFPSRSRASDHISLRQYARMAKDWVKMIGLEPSGYGTHSLRRTKALQIYRKTGTLRAVQLLLGHAKMDSTVRCLGVELEDALTIAQGIEL
ncbi:tyrosine-type recombinase/integrase [Mangrovicoccus ximenensis]|uniref:tyrosine-type recombinase/integrase n=1 Tax=Mangrovicoccus ximenensis TaxID=1911570 RepID=UPI000D3C5461